MRFALGLLAVLFLTLPASADDETISFGHFDKITVYRGSDDPKQLVLFFSGDGGWNMGVVDMAQSLVSPNTIVAGLDITGYLKKASASNDTCIYTAGELEDLSKFIQKRYNFARYRRPVLVGYSSGATLVYTTLAQAPTNTFLGGISLGFCADLKTVKPMCKGQSLSWRDDSKLGAVYAPTRKLNNPWVTLHGTSDEVCSAVDTAAFVSKVSDATYVELPKVGHGYAVQKNWLPQLKDAYRSIVDQAPNDVPATATSIPDLPLVEVPATVTGSDTLAVMLSGDGGWAGLDRDLASALSERGVAVVGLDTLRYFWTSRTPDSVGADLNRIIDYYTSAWGKKEVILIGYSFGADVLPFAARRLSAEQKSKIRKIVFLGLSESAVFEFRIGDWIGSHRADSLPVKPELEALTGTPTVCVYGEEETDTLCHKLNGTSVKVIKTKGGHHFAGDVKPIVEEIMGRQN